jgi:sugar O-acyltransferase (sialic acid O-acetyltransferase NeuD family)
LKLLILGSGGHAKCIAEIAGLLGYKHSFVGTAATQAVNEISEQDVLNNAIKYIAEGYQLICGIGDVGQIGRRRKILELYSTSYSKQFATIVHPKSIVSPNAKLRPGVFVSAGAIINADAVVGAHSIINSGSIIEHDCSIGDFCHIAPGAVLSGGVSVGDDTLIGVGAVVIQGKKVSRGSIVAAGSVVTQDLLDEKCLYAGVPATFKKRV